MIAELGQFALILALTLSLAQAGLSFAGRARRDATLTGAGEGAAPGRLRRHRHRLWRPDPRLRHLGLLGGECGREFAHRKAADLQDRRRLGQPRGLHPAVVLDADRLWLGGGALQGAALGSQVADRRGSGLPGEPLHRLYGVRLEPAAAPGHAAGGGPIAQSAAAGSGARDPSAVSLRRLRRALGGVLPGRRRPDRGPGRQRLGPLGAALDPGRLEPAHHRHHPGLVLGLLCAGLGRLVVLGSGGERQLHALAGWRPPCCTRRW